ncbi:MAG: hypothetical protein PQJ59_16425, partial [Spirochaetales bacterium]|nr:hypothetical protein [Spirochaetales bacterium]
TGYFAVFATSDDIRFMDFEIDGNELTDPTPIRGMYLGGDNCLALRLYGHDLGYLAVLAGNNQATVDCECYNIVGGDGNMPIYAKDAFGLFIAGCSLDNNYGGEYNLRYQGGTEGVISNNTLASCGESKALLTIRGDAEEEEVSGRHVVNDNFFDGESCSSMAFHVTITPQNYERNEPIEDVIFERNYINTASGGNLLSINAKYISVRNNLFDATNGSQKPILSVGYSSNIGGLPYPGYIYIYHNTFFKNTSDGVTAVTLYEQDGAAHDCVVKNNFLYAPNATTSGEGNTGPNLYTDYGEDNIISSNTENWSSSNTESVDVFEHFTVQPPTSEVTDWEIVSSSYAKGDGESVPVWSDFFGNPLYSTSTRDLGATIIGD